MIFLFTKLSWEEVPSVDPGSGGGVQGSGQGGERLVAPGPGAGDLTWTHDETHDI